ncbi:outer membrane beta-barrel protein [Microbulbifer halophilus]|uniref:Outer membrane beta-barrel protein n=1 Tax=Microbulbifer halophilus TaxID=453963 RepID=A0ABW5EBQ8_9GAMM|nr:outer membrane beta-barrel protein [Microbulbifer halophilus]MCW8125934.1 outer membrane beta-barrel protein [Microbulbifer halophilus]
MKIAKSALKMIPFVAMSTLSAGALAEGGDFFVQADIGRSNVDFKGKGVYDSGGADIDRATDTGDNKDTSSSLRAGYWFSEYFGVEAFYSRLHDAKMTALNVYEVGGFESGVIVDTEVESFPLEVSAYGVGLVAKKNFSGLFVSGRAGAAVSKVKVPSVSDSSTEAYYGASIGYDFNDMFSLSLNYDVQEAEFVIDELDYGTQINYDADFDIKTTSLGAQYRF